MIFETLKNFNTTKEIMKQLMSYDYKIVANEMSSLSGKHLGQHNEGKYTPLFNFSTHKEIIRSIYASGTTCFSTDKNTPSEDSFDNCKKIMDYVEKNGYREYTKDDLILSCSLYYVGKCKKSA